MAGGNSGQSFANADESAKKSCLKSPGWTKKAKLRFNTKPEEQAFDFSEYVRGVARGNKGLIIEDWTFNIMLIATKANADIRKANPRRPDRNQKWTIEAMITYAEEQWHAWTNDLC